MQVFGPLMERLYDTISDAVIFLDQGHRIEMFNQGAERMFGYEATEMIGRSMDLLLPERFRLMHAGHVTTFAQGSVSSRNMGDRREIFGLRKNGDEFAAEAGITKLELKGVQHLAVVVRDITLRRKFEQELRAKTSELAVVHERTRIARDLHDAVTQSLFSASLMSETLHAVIEHDRAAALRQVDQIRRLTRSALAEMRGLLIELRPGAIADGKLGDLLHQLGEATGGRANIKFMVHASERERLPPAVQVGFYRIAQEACNNVIKHSKAHAAEIQFTSTGTAAHLLVHDDGHGFDMTQVGGRHFGLVNMRERAAEFGGEIEITSAPGQGTDILVTWEAAGK
jgi:PAS domain S-box-containing protein